MKKILIIIFSVFFLTGCYDYNDLSDLGIITGVGIDFQNDKFLVTYEIVSTKKNGNSSEGSKTYQVSATGDTIAKAFLNAGELMDKVAYFDHVEIIVMDSNIARNYMKELGEYIVRSPKFRNEVYTAIVKNTTAKEVISKTNDVKPLASSYIVELLENSNDSGGAAYYAPFTLSLRHILTNGEDAKMPIITMEDDNIKLIGMGIFKDFTYQYDLSLEQASIVNLMNDFKVKTINLEYTCKNNKKTVVNIYKSNLKIEPKKEKLLIKGKVNAELIQNDCDLDLRNTEVYKKLNTDFNNILENRINEVINILKKYKSNAIPIGKNYYNHYRILNDNWINYPTYYDIDFKINKKGLIFLIERN